MRTFHSKLKKRKNSVGRCTEYLKSKNQPFWKNFKKYWKKCWFFKLWGAKNVKNCSFFQIFSHIVHSRVGYFSPGEFWNDASPSNFGPLSIIWYGSAWHTTIITNLTFASSQQVSTVLQQCESILTSSRGQNTLA